MTEKNDELLKELEVIFQLSVEELLKDDAAINRYVEYLRAFRESTRTMENIQGKVKKKDVKNFTMEQLLAIKEVQ